MPDLIPGERSSPESPVPTPLACMERCVVCGLEQPATALLDSEEVMAALLDWWMTGTLTEDTGPAAAMEDMRALLAHIKDSGFAIVRMEPGGDAGAHDDSR